MKLHEFCEINRYMYQITFDNRVIVALPTNVNPELWNVEDYIVSSRSGTLVWMVRRNSESASESVLTERASVS